MLETLEKYTGVPLTEDTIRRIRYELEKNGYNISYICVSSVEDSFLLEKEHITQFSRENGMWEKTGT